jgi:N-acetylmuramoyl-L-alanine amidase
MIINGKAVPFASSPNFTPGKNRKPLVIVLHSTGAAGATAFQGAISWLRNPVSGVSAHYVVSRDGDIVQLVQTADIAWHAGKAKWKNYTDVNKISVGVEIVHLDSKNNFDWPLEQMESVAGICKMLMDKWKIPIENIVSHASVARPVGRKVDPVNFNWERFWEILKK